MQPVLPAITRNSAGRTALMLQLSAKPWALHPSLVVNELRSFARTSTFDSLVKDLATGPMQEGPAATNAPVVIGWGRKDRLCLPMQASRAMNAFPKAEMHWFAQSGHFPMWDEPTETVTLILKATG